MTEETTTVDLRPRIEIRADVAVVSDEALDILVRDVSSGLYVRAGILVRVVRDNARKVRGLSREAGAPVIEPAPQPWLRDRLSRAAIWWERKGPKGKRRALVPSWVVENIASRDELPFPPLEGVIEAPSLRRDGSLLDQPGYDEKSAILYEPTTRFPPIAEEPTPEDALAAKTRLDDVLADFPFVAESDKAAAYAMLLTAAARPAIDGATPLFAIRATTPGTGKTLLADVCSIISTGRGAARMMVGKNDEENRKLLLATGLEGASIVLLDNIEGSFGSAAFAAALTSTQIADRLLGQSKRLTVSLRSVTWICTGNNLAFRGDLGRRAVPIDLDAGVEHPEDRTGFRHADLLAFVREHRAQLLVDCLTLLRAFLADAREHGFSKMGSFEAWDDLVRCACIFHGLGDPIAGRSRIRDESDNELDYIRNALAAWTSHFSTNLTTVHDVVHLAADQSDLRDSLLALSGKKELSALAIGHALRRIKGRLCDGQRFVTGPMASGSRLQWRVENLSRPVLPFQSNGH